MYVLTQSTRSYDRNKTESPLLALPPELRTRIWQSTLTGSLTGGDTVHVWLDVSHGIRHSVCVKSQSNREWAEVIKTSPADPPEAIDCRNYPSTHEPCAHNNCAGYNDNPLKIPTDRRLNLSVLGVCRQIHREAALIPYEANVFSLQSPCTVEPFLSALVSAQARAVRNLTLSRVGTYRLVGDRRLIGRKLRGLRDLTCSVSFNNIRFLGRVEYGDETRKAVARNVVQFGEYAPLRSVAVAVIGKVNLRVSAPQPSLEEQRRSEFLKTWAKGVEGAVMEAFGGAERAKEKREQERKVRGDVLRGRREKRRLDRGLRPLNA